MIAPYIVFEGIDGAGKTTISLAFLHALHRQDVVVAHLSQPGTISRAGQLIHDVFEQRATFDPNAMLWLFAAEMADLKPQITKMRADGVTVICDRHTMYSAFAYQAPIHGHTLIEAVLRAVEPTPPTHTYIIDVPAEVALARQAKRGKRHNRLYESRDLDKLNTLRDVYRNMAGWLEPPSFWPKNIKVLDGTRPIADNVASVLHDLKNEE